MLQNISSKYLIYAAVFACMFCCQTYGEPNDSNLSQREPNKVVLPDTNNLVPFIGDETSLSLIEAYPERYVGKFFYLIGGISIESYYNYKYEGAKKTHVSFWFREIRPNKTETGKFIHLYLEKQLSQSLVDVITKTVQSGYSGKIVRVKAVILPHRFDRDDPMMVELLNWQTLTDDRQHWIEWQITPETATEETPENTIESDKIVYRGIERNHRWFNSMYNRFGDKIVYVNTKFIDVSEQVRKPKIIDSNIIDVPVGTIIQFQSSCKIISLLSEGVVIASTNSTMNSLVYLRGLKNAKEDLYIPKGFKFIYIGQFKNNDQVLPYFILLKPLTKEEFKQALKSGIDLPSGS